MNNGLYGVIHCLPTCLVSIYCVAKVSKKSEVCFSMDVVIVALVAIAGREKVCLRLLKPPYVGDCFLLD